MAVISASGVVSPVGKSALQTFTSVRAGITRKSVEEDLYLCMPEDIDFDEPEPVGVSPISYLRETGVVEAPAEWLAFLASKALAGLEPAGAMDIEDYATAGLFLSLPPARPVWGFANLQEFLYHFYNYAEKDHLPHQEFSCSGHAGALMLLESAVRNLQEGGITHALVGGVESYLFNQWLAELDKNYRVKSTRNIDGFIPGESAAFILLENEGRPEKRGVKTQAKIEKMAQVQCSKAQTANNTGVDLGKLIASMLEGLAEAPVILCDLNGEPSRMKEWGYVVSRLGARLGDPCIMEHPADVLGDVGAASGAVLAALAPHYLSKKYPDKKRALIWTASDSGERSAVLMSL